MSTDVELELAQARVLPSPSRRQRGGWRLPVGLLVLLVGAWAVVLTQEGTPVPGLGAVAGRTAQFVSDLAGAGRAEPPAYLDPVRVRAVLGLALETVAMSVVAAPAVSARPISNAANAGGITSVGQVA